MILEHRLLAFALAAVLVLSSVATVGFAATPTPEPTPTPAPGESCSTSAEHDLRSSAAIESFNESDSVTSTVRNTEVEIVDATGFVRLSASNPNGYCVRFSVAISSEIVSPATIGEVDALNSSVTASWSARHDLEGNGTHTVVEFRVPAGESVTFAPSEARIKTLEWASKATETGNSAISWISGLWSDDSELEKREYSIRPENTSLVTVPKTSGDDRAIDGYLATYSVDGDTRPVPSDPEAPVFKIEREEEIRFMFNDPNATVQFTANPTIGDQVSYRVTAAKEALGELGELWPGMISISGEVGV
jgi:hypothetical protein